MTANVMFTEEQLILLQVKWEERFPGQIPDTRLFNSNSTTSDIIQSTNEKIEVLEFELRKQQFILNFVNSLPTKPDISHKNPPAILARTVSQTSSFKPQNSLHSSYFPAVSTILRMKSYYLY